MPLVADTRQHDNKMIIKISQDKEVQVSPEDFDRVSVLIWYFMPNVWGGYAARHEGKQTVYLHQFIIGKPKKGFQIDHINHDGLDDRRENLRIVTQHQNNGNLRRPKHNTSGYKGVSAYPNNIKKPWTAYIQNMGVKIHLGYFATPQEAALVYNLAAKEQWGKYAHLNEVEAA